MTSHRPARHQALRRRRRRRRPLPRPSPTGSIYGFIGPNGSGKTTTLRMIMHILLPDEGQIEVLGSRDTAAARDRVSYLPEERGLYKKMTVRRLLRYYGAAQGAHARRSSTPRSTSGWRAWSCRGWVDRKIETLSKGMSQKVQFIAAVISQAGAADPRRAVLRPRPGQRRGPEGRRARDAAPRRDGRLQHARHGDRREDVRSHLHDLQGPEGARRHARGDPGAVRRSTPSACAPPAAPPRSPASPDVRVGQRLRPAAGGPPDGRSAGVPQQLAARTAVYHFEVTRPSLHDIFVRIARPADGRSGA